MSAKLDAYEDFKEAWSEFCSDVLADKGTRGTYRGPAMVLVGLGDFLLDQVESLIDLHEDDDEEGGAS